MNKLTFSIKTHYWMLMMTKKKQTKTQLVGPLSYQNWKASLAHKPLEKTFEYPLYTDAHIVGDYVQYGPYLFINCLSLGNVNSPAVILRMDRYALDYTEYMNPFERWTETDAELYHKGDINDEISALVSLCMGIRLKSGMVTRIFSPTDDPKGRPVSPPNAWGRVENPTILRIKSRNPILPRVIGEHKLLDIIILSTYSNLSTENAIALIRAARLYQDALWIAESEPETSWLFLVSAVEIAANTWKRTKDSPLDILRISKFADLEAILRDAGGNSLVEDFAERIATFTGAKKKFLDFLKNFLPDPPSNRAENSILISWEAEDIKKSLGQIYDYRSEALHGGKPFPLPMCRPPLTDNQEKPNSMMLGGVAVWTDKDLPMLLQVFEYIVRNALLKWWKSMAVVNEDVND